MTDQAGPDLGGRPTKYSLEVAIAICRLMTDRKSDGKPYSLKDVCEELGLNESTVYAWKERHAEFQELYARARLDRADMMAEDVIRVVDTEDDPARARVQMDARKWYAAKLNPKQWGDKTIIGGDPDNPQKHEHLHTHQHLDELARRLTQGASPAGAGGPVSDA